MKSSSRGSSPRRSAVSYLILLGEAQAVVGLESLDVVSEIDDGDGRVLPHSWERGREEKGRALGSGHQRWTTAVKVKPPAGTMRWLRVSVEECALGSTMHGWEERVRGRRSARGAGWRFGGVVMLSEEGQRGGAGTVMRHERRHER